MGSERRGGGWGEALLALAVGVAATAVAWFLPPTERPDQPDETLWIAAGSHEFRTLFVAHDLSPEAWREPRFGPFGFGYPVLGKLAIGASVAAHGRGREAAALVRPTPAFDWRLASARRPGPALLAAGRLPARLATGLAAAALFLLVRVLGGSGALALLAVALFVARPLVLESGRQAMLDMPALALGLCTLACTARALRAEDGSWIRWLAGAAVLGGLATATKLVGGLWLGVAALWWLAGEGSLSAARAALGLCLLALLATATFLLVQPPLWGAPVEGLRAMLAQADAVATYDVPPERRLGGILPRAAAVVRVGLVGSDPFGTWTGSAAAGLAGALASVLGLVRLASRGAARRALLLWLLATAGAVLALVPFDWRRWYLPLEPLWALGQAAALAALVAWPLARGRTGARTGAR